MEGRLAPEAPNKDPVELKVLSFSEQGLVSFSFSFSLPLSFSVRLYLYVCMYVYIYAQVYVVILMMCAWRWVHVCVYVCKRFICKGMRGSVTNDCLLYDGYILPISCFEKPFDASHGSG